MSVQTTKTLTVTIPSGRKVTVEKQRARSDFQARVSIEFDNEWVFGVREDWRVELLSSRDPDGNLADVAVPDWIEYVLDEIGLRGFDGGRR